jgi:hypothetical protein
MKGKSGDISRSRNISSKCLQNFSPRFTSAKEVTANAKRALTEVSKNDSKRFTNVGKIVSLPEGKILKEILCK